MTQISRTDPVPTTGRPAPQTADADAAGDGATAFAVLFSALGVVEQPQSDAEAPLIEPDDGDICADTGCDAESTETDPPEVSLADGAISGVPDTPAVEIGGVPPQSEAVPDDALSAPLQGAVTTAQTGSQPAMPSEKDTVSVATVQAARSHTQSAPPQQSVATSRPDIAATSPGSQESPRMTHPEGIEQMAKMALPPEKNQLPQRSKLARTQDAERYRVPVQKAESTLSTTMPPKPAFTLPTVSGTLPLSRPDGTGIGEQLTPDIPPEGTEPRSFTPLTALTHTASPALIRSETHAPGAIQQLTAAITAKPNGETEIALHPEELGSVRLRLRTSDTGVVSIVIAAERPETAELLRRNLSDLQSQLAMLGVENSHISFWNHGSDAGSNHPNDSPPNGQTPDTTHEAPMTDSPRIVVQPGPRDTLDLRL